MQLCCASLRLQHAGAKGGMLGHGRAHPLRKPLRGPHGPLSPFWGPWLRKWPAETHTTAGPGMHGPSCWTRNAWPLMLDQECMAPHAGPGVHGPSCWIRNAWPLMLDQECMAPHAGPGMHGPSCWTRSACPHVHQHRHLSQAPLALHLLHTLRLLLTSQTFAADRWPKQASQYRTHAAAIVRAG